MTAKIMKELGDPNIQFSVGYFGHFRKKLLCTQQNLGAVSCVKIIRNKCVFGVMALMILPKMTVVKLLNVVRKAKRSVEETVTSTVPAVWLRQ